MAKAEFGEQCCLFDLFLFNYCEILLQFKMNFFAFNLNLLRERQKNKLRILIVGYIEDIAKLYYSSSSNSDYDSPADSDHDNSADSGYDD